MVTFDVCKAELKMKKINLKKLSTSYIIKRKILWEKINLNEDLFRNTFQVGTS